MPVTRLNSTEDMKMSKTYFLPSKNFGANKGDNVHVKVL